MVQEVLVKKLILLRESVIHVHMKSTYDEESDTLGNAHLN